MSLTYRESILIQLQALKHFEGISVEISDQEKTVAVNHRTHQSLSFKFAWRSDHFIGYFLSEASDPSQAVLSLWTPLDASNFVTAYSILLNLRAGRPSPL